MFIPPSPSPVQASLTKNPTLGISAYDWPLGVRDSAGFGACEPQAVVSNAWRIVGSSRDPPPMITQ